VCARGTDCCSSNCNIASGASVGTCGVPPSGSSFCNGGVEGSTCASCNDCCSRLCAPYAASGVMVCQPASGCHVTGDFCHADKDCCGTAGTDLPGAGHVTCEKAPGADLGICRNPMACNPQGDVCHYKNYTCGSSSARADCCGGLGAKGGVCQLDGLGVPRCNGLGDTCRNAGDECASADDCCDNRPCVPDAQGQLRCYNMPKCVPSAGPCTITGDCCPGTSCIRAVGAAQGTCGQTPPPPGTGTGGTTGSGGTGSGGTGSGGTGGDGAGGSGGTGTPVCSQYGQICTQASDCCNGIPCDQGICRLHVL
jgi:hypothetical protein